MVEVSFEPVVDGLFRSAALLAGLLILLTSIRPYVTTRRPLTQRVACGVVLGLFSVASMIWPITSDCGFLFDTRVVPVVLAAPFFGLAAGLATLAIAVPARLVIGGAGTLVGLATLAIAFVGGAAVALRRGWRLFPETEVLSPIAVGTVAVLALVAMASATLPMLVVAVATPAPPSFLRSTLVVAILLPVFTFVCGLVLRTDEVRRALERGLHETNEQLKGFIAHVPGVIYRRRWDKSGMPFVDFMAGRVREVLGVDPEEASANGQVIFDRVVPEDQPKMLEAIRQAMAGSQTLTTEFRIRHGDGSIRWLHVVSQSRIDRLGDGVGDGVIMDITPLKEAEAQAALSKERADYLAGHDVLTGLATRLALVNEAMRIARGSGERLALIMVDLIDSSGINERFGHAIGDARILTAARRLTPFRPPDHVARMAGDIFGLLVPGDVPDEELEALCRRVLDALSLPLVIAGAIVPLHARCGYASIEGGIGSAEMLVRSAEIALDAARERAEIQPLRYSAAIEDERLERRLFSEALAAAIDTGGLTLVWQPIVDARDGSLVGREALARWRRPGYGEVPPDRFVAAAERVGLWRALDRHILLSACRVAARRENFGWISVNVTSNWVREGDLVAVVREVLGETGLQPGRLWLEFTERIAMDQLERAAALLDSLRAIGVHVAIDDFGAVYSSLSYLHQLPVGKIKLDRSFVTDLENNSRARAIVESVIALCQSLDIIVVAEGVETEGQLVWLRRRGCSYLQGYLIGRPVPEADALAALMPHQAFAMDPHLSAATA